MRLISWNVNGIRAAAGKGLFETMASIDADIVCLQETKISLDNITLELSYVPGYVSYFHSAEKKGYSGTAIYTKREPKSVSYGLGDARFDTEGRTISMDFGDFLLYNIYFPNGGQSEERLRFKLSFYEKFIERIGAEIQSGRQVIVCGDVNTAHREIDLARPKDNVNISGFLPEERAYLDRFEEIGLTDTFRLLHKDERDAYTWWSYKTFARKRNVGWRIDYFYVSPGLRDRVEGAAILSSREGSDHCPVELVLK